jgi:large subunit ribosomal protein L35
MPKMKSHSGAKQRYRTTGNGKVMRRQQNHGHKLVGKSPKRKRRLKAMVQLSKGDMTITKKILGKPVNNI